MEICGCHFEYAGESSRKFNLIMASVNTERDMRLNGNTTSVTLFNKKERRNYMLGTDYKESVLEFDAEVVAESPITLYDRRAIENWLFNQKTYQKLYFDTMDDVFAEAYDMEQGEGLREYLNCRFVNPEKIEGNGGLMGYKFTVECDSNMAWMDTTTLTPTIANGACTVYVDSDGYDYIYPKVTIQMGTTGGNISLTNNTDSSTRVTSLIGVAASAQFCMDGSINYISGGNYSKFGQKNFLRFVPGKNTISVTGDVSALMFQWNNRRYL